MVNIVKVLSPVNVRISNDVEKIANVGDFIVTQDDGTQGVITSAQAQDLYPDEVDKETKRSAIKAILDKQDADVTAAEVRTLILALARYLRRNGVI